MSWLERLIPSISGNKKSKQGVPEGIWTKCSECQAVLYRAELEKLHHVCPKCDHHMRISAKQRLDMFLDKDSREVIAADVESVDVLKFKDSKRYKDRLSAAQKKTGEKDALVVMRGSLMCMPVVVSSFDFAFLGGSMGAALGERFVQAVNRAIEDKVPFVNFSASGGARMQEALISLMQMAKTSAVLAKLSDKGLPFISVLTDPTMGGVSASLAMLGDVIIAEPKTLIGFAGPRVIEQTVRQTLPDGFQRSEFLLEHGAIDMIVARKDMRTTVARLLAKLMKRNNPENVAALSHED
mgnify:CR=1 FL=1|tara:strand:+ start:124231 stop:125118 length:888 start_codon:yes stop_codon:yes gene_type:complete